MLFCDYCKRQVDERCDLCIYKKEVTEVKKMDEMKYVAVDERMCDSYTEYFDNLEDAKAKLNEWMDNMTKSEFDNKCVALYVAEYDEEDKCNIVYSFKMPETAIPDTDA